MLRSRTNFQSKLLVATALTALAALSPNAALAKNNNKNTAPEITALPEASFDVTSAPRLDLSNLSEDRVISSFGGDVDPQWGRNIRSFWGRNIRSFWGRNIRAFEDEGEVVSFWRNIRAFDDGGQEIEAFWGRNIRSFESAPEWAEVGVFWGDVESRWRNIRSFWDVLGTGDDTNLVDARWRNIRAFEEGDTDYAGLAGEFDALMTESAAFWGDAVTERTGATFENSFADPLLAKHNIDLDDPTSLASKTEYELEVFFLDWYDNLMLFSGRDSFDYWMGMVNWTPELTQTLGEGSDSVIGLLDFSVTGKEAQNIVRDGGVSTIANGHGSAVASMMVAPHDGVGVMGIAPRASVVAFNPFDESGTASWADVTAGVLNLAESGASIINMSLGVPGYALHPEWNTVFSNEAIAAVSENTVFVTAAGNEGVTQTQNIDWNYNVDPNLIVVGSIDPTGNISSFSNLPGEACLLTDGVCKVGGELKNRFIVAPGEMLLVADGNDGVTRLSGTSFAAPIVSGTIALMHDRWPWLADHGEETVQIVLDSAQDLGEEGIDGTYGVGLLDVQAALSPLNYDNLIWYESKEGKLRSRKQTQVRNQSNASKWESKGMYFYAFEEVGDTFRDFAIPLSSKLIDQTITSAGDSEEQFQAYLYNGVTDWIAAGFAGNTSGPSLNFAAVTSQMPNSFGMNMSVTFTPRQMRNPNAINFIPYQTAVNFMDPDGGMSFTIGEGDGAVEMAGIAGFGNASDYDPNTGGANPLLGFASGGAYANFNKALTNRLNMTVGVTQANLQMDLDTLARRERLNRDDLQDYDAGAQTISFAYEMSGWADVTVGYTRLQEDDALLGVQSLDADDFGGSVTDGVSVGTHMKLGKTLSLTAMGTVGQTRTTNNASLIQVADGGLRTTAFQVALDKAQLISERDSLRVSVSQPMHVEQGAFEYSVVRVIDRQTGEIGSVVESVDVLSRQRPLVAEFDYGHSFKSIDAGLRLFGRAQVMGETASEQAAAFLAGARFDLAY